MRPRSAQSPEYQLLAQRLKIARLHPSNGDRKVTQEDLAAKLGKARSFPFKVENAERELNALELVDYCNALGVDFFDFMRDVLQEVERLRKCDGL